MRSSVNEKVLRKSVDSSTSDLGSWKKLYGLEEQSSGMDMARNTLPRVSRRINIKQITLFWVGALLIVIGLFIKYSKDYNITQVYMRRDLDQTTKTVRNTSYVYTWPRCEQNMSAASITDFDKLPGHIQDFLYHRHCRHFPMLLDIPDKCGGVEGSAEVFLLLVIKSSPGNYDRREVLRKTWAQERLSNGVWIRRIFISGTSESGFEKERLNEGLQMEHRQYNDILQWDFRDTFYNLTLKQVVFLEWMERNCPHARFLLNGDDDVFAHTDNMVEYLQRVNDIDGNKHLFTGHLIQGVGPIRVTGSKYYIPVQVQKSDSYPPYCGGGGFLLSGYTAMVIYNMSHSIEILPIDDVYMGMCLFKAGLSPQFHMGVTTSGVHIPSKKVDAYDPCFYRDFLLVHRFLSTNMYIMWHRLHDPDLKCSSNRY